MLMLILSFSRSASLSDSTGRGCLVARACFVRFWVLDVACVYVGSLMRSRLRCCLDQSKLYQRGIGWCCCRGCCDDGFDHDFLFVS
jgi:hypothetical protein